MAEAKQQRKLSTILAMDVINYTAKMGADEVGTLKQLAECRKIIEKSVEEQAGRIFNTAGDAFMVEFASPVGAVSAAISIQKQIKQRNQTIQKNDHFEFRMGINMGDVIIDGDNLFGDGVNVAARLEGISPPSGICISEMIHSVVDGKVEAEFVDQGLQTLKNVEKPIRAFYVDLDPSSGKTRKFKPFNQSRQSKLKFVVAGLVGLGIIAIGYLQFSGLGKQKDTEFNRIAVLPLDSPGGGSEEQSLAVGLSQDLGNNLTRVANDLAIITLNQKPEDLSEVRGSTGANYILNGSVRTSGENVRVSIALIDAADISSIWAKSYDRKMEGSNIFLLQDEIVGDIVKQLVGSGAVLTKDLNKRVAKRGTDNLTAYECVNFARGVAIGGVSGAEDNDKAIKCLSEAVKLDPSYADAWRWFGLTTSWLYSTYGADKSVLTDAADYAAKAVSLDPGDGEAYSVQAEVAYYNGDWETMYSSVDKAIELLPGNPFVHGQGAWLTAVGGDCTTEQSTDKDAKPGTYVTGNCRWQKGCWDLALKAVELDVGNLVPYKNYLLCNCYNVIGEGEKALEMLLPLQHTSFHWWHIQVGMAYHMAGNEEKARFHAKKTQEILGTTNIDDLFGHFKIWNMQNQIWPVYEPIFKTYGWI